MAKRKVVKKKIVRKSIAKGIVYISATFNNTMVTVTDEMGNAIAWSSAGGLGFKGSKKSTPYAAQQAVEDALTKAKEHGIKEVGIKVKYLHSDIKTLERTEIIRNLRLGEFDVLIGINLLREGLDVPEVSLVAILDADKEGFLRSERALVQTIGRAARNANGRVIMYADKITDSMQRAIDETNRRRSVQEAYNKEHGIVPKTIVKNIRDLIAITHEVEKEDAPSTAKDFKKMSQEQRREAIELLELDMRAAAKALDFEKAADLRDVILELRAEYKL